jgi:hypothetical protein
MGYQRKVLKLFEFDLVCLVIIRALPNYLEICNVLFVEGSHGAKIN